MISAKCIYIKTSIFFFLSLLGFQTAILHAQRDRFIPDSLDLYVKNGLKKWNIPGAAIAVIQDGKIILTKGYGVRDMNSETPVDENTLFMIASNSKAVTGTILATLEQEKKLTMEDKVSQWLPDFKLFDPNSTTMLTIEDLVSHRMGFETFQGDFCHWSTKATTADVIRRMALIKPVYGFRDKWGYCNAGYAVAGEIIKKASGLSWSEYVKNKIFGPLEMKNSLTLTADFPSSDNHCSPHTIYENKLIPLKIPNIDNMAPATSICSSVADWSKWLSMIINKGIWQQRQIIPQAAIDKSITPVSLIGNYKPMYNTGHFAMYGLGWKIQDYCDLRMISHTGGADGFVTSVTWVPEKKCGVIVFTNTDANSFYQAAKMEILDALLEKPFRDYSDTMFQKFQVSLNEDLKWIQQKKDTVSMNRKPSVALDEFTGKYENEVYGSMNIIRKGKELEIYFPLNECTGRLESLGENRFLCTYSNPLLGIKEFPFEVQNGKVKSVKVSCANFVEFTNYDFKKIN